MINPKEKKWLNYIGGQWLDSGDKIAVLNPANNTIVAHIARASISDADKALTAAQQAFRSRVLADMRPFNRAKILLAIADEIRLLADLGARVLCLENGKRLSDAQDEFEEAAMYFQYYAGMVDKTGGRFIPLGGDYVDFTNYEPCGVSVQIIPWNFPVSLAARSLAPALATGNSVVVKSPELSPLAMVILFEAIEKALCKAKMPAGLVNLLCGVGSDVGHHLTAHAMTNQIVFTGSVKTGQAIMRAAVEHVVPTVMELGGKSAAIAFADCDTDELIVNVKNGIFFHAGQVCSAMSRLLVDRAIYKQVLAKLKTMAEGLEAGAGMENSDITPLLSAEQLKMVDRACQQAKKDNVPLLTGGEKLAIDGGYFFKPTIFYDVDPKAEIAQEEVFGPILVVIPFDSEKEAIDIVNGTNYGLVNGVFTHDINRALRVAKALDSGQVFVNEWFAGGIETPFGGNKKSGFGREKGQEAIYGYVKLKNTAIKLKTALG